MNQRLAYDWARGMGGPEMPHEKVLRLGRVAGEDPELVISLAYYASSWWYSLSEHGVGLSGTSEFNEYCRIVIPVAVELLESAGS